jgi:hypothetical protein
MAKKKPAAELPGEPVTNPVPEPSDIKALAEQHRKIEAKACRCFAMAGMAPRLGRVLNDDNWRAKFAALAIQEHGPGDFKRRFRVLWDDYKKTLKKSGG